MQRSKRDLHYLIDSCPHTIFILTFVYLGLALGSAILSDIYTFKNWNRNRLSGRRRETETEMLPDADLYRGPITGYQRFVLHCRSSDSHFACGPPLNYHLPAGIYKCPTMCTDCPSILSVIWLKNMLKTNSCNRIFS